tara:strand:+ start:8661 stop:10370 length:1710 start_codon:yes stop_codon:yes gene_type:complete
MIKNLTLSISLSLFGLCAFAQTIVTTTPENRKVILEEFTGVNCTFCPQGHAIAQTLQDNNPGEVFLVNIHSGGYATPNGNQPDFRTQWGEAIDNQSGLAGYPAGTINRQNFPGQEQGNSGTTALGRGQWVGAASSVLTQGSYVNVGVEASLNVQTSIMTIDVEAYYTGNSPEATNKFNVAILQNNTLGPQVGGNMGNNYMHQHRLISMVTGQWGVDINNTTTGSLYSNQFNFEVPSDVNGIPVELGNLEVVVFVTETTQLIPSGSGTYPAITGLNDANDVNLRSVADIEATCSTSVAPVINIQNTGQNELTSVVISYDVNSGATESYTWTGSLLSLESTDIELPEVSFTSQSTNTITASVPNDDFNGNNESSTSFDGAVETAGTMDLSITTDDWAEELTWNFKNSSGAILESGSYSANSDDQTTFEYRFNFDDDCMTFSAFDSYGDGLTAGGNGGIELKDANGVMVYSFNGNYGSGFSVEFDSDGQLGLGNNDFATIQVFPNPTSDILNIANVENANIEVYNLLGQVMTVKTNISNTETVDVSGYATGAYFVKISNGTLTTTKKFVVVK